MVKKPYTCRGCRTKMAEEDRAIVDKGVCNDCALRELRAMSLAVDENRSFKTLPVWMRRR